MILFIQNIKTFKLNCVLFINMNVSDKTIKERNDKHKIEISS